MVYRIRDLVGHSQCQAGLPYGAGTMYVRSIPIRYYGGYVKAAWEVLRGRAVAVRYPIDGELEAALAASGGISIPDLSQPTPPVAQRGEHA